MTGAEHHAQAERCLDNAAADLDNDRAGRAAWWQQRALTHAVLALACQQTTDQPAPTDTTPAHGTGNPAMAGR